MKSAWTYLCLSRCSSVENICVIHYPILVPPAAQPNAPDYLTLYKMTTVVLLLIASANDADEKRFNLPLSASLTSFENIYVIHNQILIVHVPTRSNHKHAARH